MADEKPQISTIEAAHEQTSENNPDAASEPAIAGPSTAGSQPAQTETAEASQGQDQAQDKASAQPESEAAVPVAAPVAAPAADKEDKTDKVGDASKSPIQQLFAAFKSQSHPEIWGVALADPETHVPSQIVFQKYLNANDGNVAKAKDQLVKTLAWRAEAKPLELVDKPFSKPKFEGLGYVTSHGSEDGTDPLQHEVFTWNVYGAAAKRLPETFGNTDEFIQWRVALMELGIARLNLAAAETPITASADPYKLYQVHDYQSISFLRQPAEVKAATSKVIPLFAQNYPELLKEKFFVNVPAFMGFMYTFAKLIVPAKTVKKFHPMSNGAGLAGEFAETKVKGLGNLLPAAYGGNGADLKEQGRETSFEESAAAEGAAGESAAAA